MDLDASTPEFQLFVEGRYDELSETAVVKTLCVTLVISGEK